MYGLTYNYKFELAVDTAFRKAENYPDTLLKSNVMEVLRVIRRDFMSIKTNITWGRTLGAYDEGNGQYILSALFEHPVSEGEEYIYPHRIFAVFPDSNKITPLALGRAQKFKSNEPGRIVERSVSLPLENSVKVLSPSVSEIHYWNKVYTDGVIPRIISQSLSVCLFDSNATIVEFDVRSDSNIRTPQRQFSDENFIPWEKFLVEVS